MQPDISSHEFPKCPERQYLIVKVESLTYRSRTRRVAEMQWTLVRLVRERLKQNLVGCTQQETWRELDYQLHFLFGRLGVLQSRFAKCICIFAKNNFKITIGELMVYTCVSTYAPEEAVHLRPIICVNISGYRASTECFILNNFSCT